VAGALACHQLSDSGPLLRFTARSALPEAMRAEARRTMDRLTQGYGHIVVDGIADGSIRPVDPSIAADMITGAINAVVELGHWLPGFDVDEALDLFLRPLMHGLRNDPLPS
ncbi:MAG TPA: TetR/AcrR family transcriptional regulator, partial [Quisquiliibacterium sp.]|nr:TetR/AcrR family transcriptional regulator [Quisquiliibacterium sp.]